MNRELPDWQGQIKAAGKLKNRSLLLAGIIMLVSLLLSDTNLSDAPLLLLLGFFFFFFFCFFFFYHLEVFYLKERFLKQYGIKRPCEETGFAAPQHLYGAWCTAVYRYRQDEEWYQAEEPIFPLYNEKSWTEIYYLPEQPEISIPVFEFNFQSALASWPYIAMMLMPPVGAIYCWVEAFRQLSRLWY